MTFNLGYKFYPRYAFITVISQSQNAIVTFLGNHDYTDGEILSFRIPQQFGMIQLNNQQATVISHTANTVTIDVNSLQFNPFIYAGADNAVPVPAMAVPSASGIVPNSFPRQTNLMDAFDNVSTT